MRRMRGLLVTVSTVGLIAGLGIGSSAQSDAIPWITVDKVLVNKIGGLSVVGRVDCSAIYQQLTGDGVWVWGEGGQGDWATAYALTIDPETQSVDIYSNADNYTVSQPAGRRGMIQVTHGSSRAGTCYVDPEFDTGDWVPPCESSGSPCRWVTDRWGWDSTEPLFDVSADGKFKPGLVHIEVENLGGWIDVQTRDGSGNVIDQQSYQPVDGELCYAYNNLTIKAVNYKG